MDPTVGQTRDDGSSVEAKKPQRDTCWDRSKVAIRS